MTVIIYGTEYSGFNVRFNASRHTFGTSLLTAGVDIYTICKLMGHSKTKTTMIYAKIVNKRLDEAIELLDKYL